MTPLACWQIIIILLGAILVGRVLAGLAWRLLGKLFAAARPLRIRAPHAVDRLAHAWPRSSRQVRRRLAVDRFNGLPLTLIVVLAGYVVFLATGLAEDVVEGEAVVKFDHHINQALAVIRDPGFLHATAWITHTADTATLAAVTLVSLGFLWADRRPAYIPGLLVSVIGSQAIAYIGKYAIDRARPDFLTFASASTPSFPSGHATGALAVYGFIAYAIARDVQSTRARFELGYWTLVLVLMIAASRLVLSVHYASDVAAGLLVGGFWLLAGLATTELVRERLGRRNPG